MKEILLPEIHTVGIYNSQLAAKGRSITQDRQTTMFEIELPAEDGGIAYIDSESMPITSDTIICAKPGQLRHTKFPFKCLYIHMRVNDGALCELLMNLPNFIKIGSRRKYEEIFLSLCRRFGSVSEGDRILMNGLVMELVGRLAGESNKSTCGKSTNDEVIQIAVRYIRENIDSDLSLKAMAERFSFSPVHFHNRFKSATGKTLHEFVEDERIKKAADLLTSTDMTLTQTAYRCGFSSQSYFSYAFKRKMNLTPREYAREIFRRYEE